MIIKILRFMNILDDDGSLSLSHIALAVAIFLTARDPGRDSILVLLLCFLNFNGKKLFSWLKERKRSSDHERLSAMQAQIDKLHHEFQKLNAATTFSKLGR